MNNRYDNLRWVTTRENMRNRNVNSNNKSGITGVLSTRHGTWVAHCGFDSKNIRKTFKTKKEAMTQRQIWEQKHNCTFETPSQKMRREIDQMIVRSNALDTESRRLDNLAEIHLIQYSQ